MSEINYGKAISLFLFSAIAFEYNSWKRRKEQKNLHSSIKESRLVTHEDKISSRGASQLNPILPYLGAFFKCLSDPCHPVQNPTGHIALCVAENKLPLHLLSDRLTENKMSSIAFSNHDVYCYNSFLGLSQTREAIAYFLAKRFYGIDVSSKEDALKQIDPENVVIGSGCASLLNSLFYCLAEEGDAVLIPAPYYAAFESDMKAVAKCVPFPVYMENPACGPTEEELKHAASLAKQKGYHIKILLLTNPNNPLGVIYDSKIVENCILWARKNDMHTIVDEIYALSVQNESDNFSSVIRVLSNELCDDVHMVWALSKDFCSSGFRVGVLYTQNKTLINGLSNLNVFSGVSHPMQMVLTDLLTDDKFIDSFLNESRKLLKRSYDTCVENLKEMEIPFVQAEAGIFIYCDFSALLPEPTFENEKILSDYLNRYARIVLTPGACQRENKAGMFRICYAWVSHEVLCIAFERMKKLLMKINEDGFVSVISMDDDEIIKNILLV